MSFDNTTAVQVTNSLLKGRFSCRYYTHEAVSRETIEEIIDAARHAPSASNIQYVLFLCAQCSKNDLTILNNQALVEGVRPDR